VAVSQTYQYNPTGTEASHTNPKTSSDATYTWSYEYAPTNEAVTELSPLGKEVHRDVDARGNTLFDFDEEGHRTGYAYDSFDQVTRQTDPRARPPTSSTTPTATRRPRRRC